MKTNKDLKWKSGYSDNNIFVLLSIYKSYFVLVKTDERFAETSRSIFMLKHVNLTSNMSQGIVYKK